MEHFKLYSQFLLEFYQDEEEPAETEKKDTAPYQDFVSEFSDSFGYNKIEIDQEGYNPEIETALSKFEEFINNNKTEDGKNPTINSVDLKAQGAASWVSTNYPDKEEYNYENNKPLARDRGAKLGETVLEDIKKYLADKGYDVNTITFNAPEAFGIVRDKESREVLTKFVKENFNDNRENLVAQMASAAGGKGKTAPKSEVKFFKDPNADEELKTRTQYEGNEDYFEVHTLEAKNADRIFELLSETPAYVTFTARLKSGDQEIRTLYKDNAQNAYVKVVINAQSKKEDEPEPEPEPSPQPQKEGKKFDVKSIPFKKDSAN